MRLRTITGLILSTAILLTIAAPLLASKFPPDCICEITARVLEISEKTVPKNESQQENLTSVSMLIEIIRLEGIVKKGVNPLTRCEDRYKPGQTLKLSVVKEKDYVSKEATIVKGSIIKGWVELTGDEWGSGYYFYRIEPAP